MHAQTQSISRAGFNLGRPKPCVKKFWTSSPKSFKDSPTFHSFKFQRDWAASTCFYLSRILSQSFWCPFGKKKLSKRSSHCEKKGFLSSNVPNIFQREAHIVKRSGILSSNVFNILAYMFLYKFYIWNIYESKELCT